MRICRFATEDGAVHLGVIDGRHVHDLTASGLAHFASWTDLLRASATTPLAALLTEVALGNLPIYAYSELDRTPSPGTAHLLAPVDRQEVWAAGVTYAWSREARMRETRTKDVYVRVYDAQRPELFFKALGEKVVGPNDWIGLRHDSRWNVPEPELALIINPSLEIVGYAAGNDVSSRDIEGENPLYLPQAKIYRHSCAIGPAVTVAETALDARSLTINLTVRRAAKTVFQGETSTSKIHRSLEELVTYLGYNNDFPYGAVLLTGTGIVPGDDFTLQNGDVVEIDIAGIGLLRNSVRQL